MQLYDRYRRSGLLSHAGNDYASLAKDRFIIGDPPQVAAEIQRYRELFDVTYLICRMALPAVPHEHIQRSMRLFSAHVAPQFRGA
jgi:alkanesulfonate monooxygenase SsuD/methylene tetrahydromethanopterin reductase-like flavin-dependent oxidoreductase (luciferase family)